MVKKRQQLSLDELQQLRWALGTALAVLSAWTAFFLDVGAELWIAAVTLAGAAVLRWPWLPSRVPAWAHRLAFPVIVAVFVVDFYASRETLPVLVRVELLLLVYRLVSYRKRRDDLQIVILGLFLVVVAGVLTVSLFFAVQILAFTACSLGFLLLTTLVDAGRASEPPVVPGEVPGWAREVHWGRLAARVRAAGDWRVVALGTLLFAGVVVVSALLFLSIPRFELGNSLFLDRLIKKQSRTGFSENVRFGDVTNIQEDERVAFTVDLDDASRLPGVPYWRMVVLDDYRDNGFRMSPELRLELTARLSERRLRASGGASGRKGDSTTWRFYYEPGVSRYLPLAGGFHEVRFNRALTFHHQEAARILALVTEPAELLGFEVTGMDTGAVLPDAPYAEREHGRNRPAKPRPDYRRLNLSPEDRGRLESWVAELTGGVDLPAEEFARRATQWLAQRHTYSMESALPPGAGDPLVRWLSSNGPGHCEFFAGGFALLARAAGHPVRLVTGFKGGNWNAFSESLIVRNSMAHAWCEVWNGRDAWVRVDPTPGAFSVGEPGPEVAAAQARGRRLDSGWGARFDGLRVFWYRRVVNFDQGTQLELASGAKRGVQDGIRWMREQTAEHLKRVEVWLRSPWSGATWITALVITLALALGAWAVVRYGRGAWWWLITAGRRREQGDPIRREAGRWLVRLEALEGGPDPERDQLRADLLRLRYGQPERAARALPVFTRARRVTRLQARARQ
ncbi:MAG TPA: DUF3488 and transglutaminase-like domain-containing protein [Opitutaceae bacterium]|jgi:transglutaminase-like putative cysteine protease|nr:DUF3488 and transglutaminase-like domain-containing protein [Opitutaceae bacterium]